VTVVWWWCGGAGILNHWFPDKTEKKIKGEKTSTWHVLDGTRRRKRKVVLV